MVKSFDLIQLSKEKRKWNFVVKEMDNERNRSKFDEIYFVERPTAKVHTQNHVIIRHFFLCVCVTKYF